MVESLETNPEYAKYHWDEFKAWCAENNLLKLPNSTYNVFVDCWTTAVKACKGIPCQKPEVKGPLKKVVKQATKKVVSKKPLSEASKPRARKWFKAVAPKKKVLLKRAIKKASLLNSKARSKR